MLSLNTKMTIKLTRRRARLPRERDWARYLGGVEKAVSEMMKCNQMYD
jgi:hypothetical protein